MLTQGGFHLTYCTNIHPGESWQAVRTHLEEYLPKLKLKLAPDQPFGVGLRLSNQAAQEILQGDALQKFAQWLKEEDLYVFTLNGFPYGGFHHQKVKEQVYHPDWTTRERLNYTLRLIKILGELLPEGVEGSISTCPLAYQPRWVSQAQRKTVLQQACVNLALVTEALLDLRDRTGKRLHLDLEPEPDGFLEDTASVLVTFQEWIWPMAGSLLAERQGVSCERAELWLQNFIRLCYDACHFAVVYENPVQTFNQWQAAGIRIGKIQLSSALRLVLPPTNPNRDQLRVMLQPFTASPYLHQVVERFPDGNRRSFQDLALALPQLADTPAQEWRIHFHVPVFLENYQEISSTQAELRAVLKHLQKMPSPHHLEIETYTWEVLPPTLKTDLLTSIAREYAWVLTVLNDGPKG